VWRLLSPPRLEGLASADSTISVTTASDGTADLSISSVPSAATLASMQGFSTSERTDARTALGLGSAATASSSDFAASSHTHPLSGLTQSGASAGQVPQWNGTAWAPATPAAAVSDGDKGDITVSGSGTVWTVDARAITAGKWFSVGATKPLGRHTGTAGDVQEISVDGGLEFHGGQLRRAALTGPVTAAAGSNATTLAQNGAATGNYYKWDGASWVPAVISYLEDIEDIPSTFTPAAHTHTLSNLTQSGATTGQVAQWNGTAWVPATAGSSVMKPRWTSFNTSGSTTASIPVDNTKPQNTEGFELIKLTSVTPSSASNTIEVTFAANISVNNSTIAMIALFIGTDLDAAGFNYDFITATNGQILTCRWLVPAWSGAKDIAIRVANNATLYWSRAPSADFFGGSMSVSLVARELEV